MSHTRTIVLKGEMHASLRGVFAAYGGGRFTHRTSVGVQNRLSLHSMTTFSLVACSITIATVSRHLFYHLYYIRGAYHNASLKFMLVPNVKLNGFRVAYRWSQAWLNFNCAGYQTRTAAFKAHRNSLSLVRSTESLVAGQADGSPSPTCHTARVTHIGYEQRPRSSIKQNNQSGRSATISFLQRKTWPSRSNPDHATIGACTGFV